jgi:hypothetical protein
MKHTMTERTYWKCHQGRNLHLSLRKWSGEIMHLFSNEGTLICLEYTYVQLYVKYNDFYLDVALKESLCVRN